MNSKFNLLWTTTLIQLSFAKSDVGMGLIFVGARKKASKHQIEREEIPTGLE